jgi:Glycosyltransferase family 87
MKVQARWDCAALTVLVWSALVTGIAVHAFFYPATHTVYEIYAPAARSWWAGRDLYVCTSDYFRYSPLVAISFTPFAVLPDEFGGALWKVTNCVIFAAGLWAWVRLLLPRDLTSTEIAGLFLLVLPASLPSMYNGQANMMMLGAFLLALAAVAEGRWNWSAAWMAWATLIKGYPLALAMLLAVLYPKRFPLRFVVALAIGLLVPFLAQRPAVVATQYVSWVKHLQESTPLMHARSRSLDYLLETCQLAIPGRAFTMAGVVAGLLVLAAVRITFREHVAETALNLHRMFAWFVTWLVLFGPAMEACTYAVMSPAIAWAIVDNWRRRGGWFRGLVLSVSLLLTGPVATDAFGPTIRRYANAHGFQPLGAVVFLGYLLFELWLMLNRGDAKEDCGGATAAAHRPKGRTTPRFSPVSFLLGCSRGTSLI